MFLISVPTYFCLRPQTPGAIQLSGELLMKNSLKLETNTNKVKQLFQVRSETY